ncbi:hypothetical protein MAHJHV29_49760 [Mycobacterium avium subsp. hominissuis]
MRIRTGSAPTHIDVEELRAALGAVDGVTGVHDLHVWTLSPVLIRCAVHMSLPGDSVHTCRSCTPVTPSTA